MIIEEHKSLKAYNTFGIDVNARYFISVRSISELREVLQSDIHKQRLILGGGSNILFTKNIDALVIHMNIKGVQTKIIDEESILLDCSAGENWHELVRYCIDNNYGGIENLSLIPGNAGTAPIQNIGAYGVEIKNVLDSCSVLNLETLTVEELSAEECEFGYRDSIFKNKAKNKYILLGIRLRLTRKDHNIHINYGDIQKELEKAGCTTPSIRDISDAIIRIRQSKLPNPKELGNGGSFFKNPVISKEEFEKFHHAHPEAPFYKVEKEQYKIPAGWLIDQAGLKGYRKGDAGVHKNQALVLVNHGKATGKEILDLAIYIQKKIQDKYGISIVPEINIL